MKPRVPQKWYEWITIPVKWVATAIVILSGVGFLIRILLYPIQWGWAIAERLLQ